MDILRQLAAWALQVFDQHQLSLLFVLLAVEEAGIPIPIPGDTILLLAGDQTRQLGMHSLAVLGATTLAVVVGSSLLFFVIRFGGRPLVQRYGRYLRIHPERLAKLERSFQHRGLTIMIVGRLIPGLRIVTTVVAGLSGISYGRFVLSVSLAGLIWGAAWYLLGVLLGHQVTLLVSIAADLLDHVPTALLVLSVVLLLASFVVGALFAHRGHQNRVRRAKIGGPS